MESTAQGDRPARSWPGQCGKDVSSQSAQGRSAYSPSSILPQSFTHINVFESLDGVAPTIGFASVDLNRRDKKIRLYDLGGGRRIRDIWANYYPETFGVIFVVDASDRERLDEVKTTFAALIADHKIREKPVLLLLNKSDVGGAVDEVEASELLQLQKLVNLHRTPCRIETCSAAKGSGKEADAHIASGFAWLLDQTATRFPALSERTQADVRTQKAAQEAEKIARAERVRLARAAREEEETELSALPPIGGPRVGNGTRTPFRPLPDIREEAEGTPSDANSPAPPNRLQPLDPDPLNSHAAVPRLPPIRNGLPPPMRELPPLGIKSEDPFLTKMAAANDDIFTVDVPVIDKVATPVESTADPFAAASPPMATITKQPSSDDGLMSGQSESGQTKQRQRKRKRLRRFQNKTLPMSEDSEEPSSVREDVVLERLPSSEPRPPSPPSRNGLPSPLNLASLSAHSSAHSPSPLPSPRPSVPPLLVPIDSR